MKYLLILSVLPLAACMGSDGPSVAQKTIEQACYEEQDIGACQALVAQSEAREARRQAASINLYRSGMSTMMGYGGAY